MKLGCPIVYPTEDASAVPPVAGIGLAALFTSHILHDGELVLLVLKPSLWFIPLQSLLFAAVAFVFAVGAALANGRLESQDRVYFEVALVLIAVRLMWAVLQWMGRLYVLTDQRILRLAGVFSTDIFSCPLRKVATARRTATARERFLALGSIEIVPSDQKVWPASWQTVARPKEVHAEIMAAINRAKQ
jgi:Bacterial PH domain